MRVSPFKGKTWVEIYGPEKAEEMRANLSIKKTDGHLSEEHKKKISISHKGKHYSTATEFKKGHVVWSFGKVLSEEHKRKLSGHEPHNKGKTFEEEYGIERAKDLKAHLSKAHQGKPSESHPNWQGGKSFDPYPIDFNKSLKRRILERDGYKCIVCGDDKILHIHHIDYNKKNNKPSNLISLCKSCHAKTNFNREYWTEQFQIIIKEASF